MKYLEYRFFSEPNIQLVKDILPTVLGSVGFDSFVDDGESLLAYIQVKLANQSLIDQTISDFPLDGIAITYTYKEAEDKNWNEEWEKNFFQPLVIDNKCVIHSTFHKEVPTAQYEIIINPQMAFGTGHHETTTLMVKAILEHDFNHKVVLDMGCGTAILALLSSMRGAQSITAIDIDEWCVRNSLENIALNEITNISVQKGDASTLPIKETYDVILANINRNILLEDMNSYTQALKKGGLLIISGFYSEDVKILTEKAKQLGLKSKSSDSLNNWTRLIFLKG